MGYCQIHGNYNGDGCFQCRLAEEKAELDSETLLQEVSELRKSQDKLAYAINNPGDYPCPHCRFKTLLRKASRCPKCQKEIDPEYWTIVDKVEENARRAKEDARLAAEDARRVEEEARRIKEEAAKRIKEEEWQRSEPERQQQNRIKRRRIFYLIIFYGYLLPILTWLSYVLFYLKYNLHHITEWLFLLLIPVVNWIWFSGVLFKHLNNTDTQDIFIGFLLVWTIVGIVGLKWINGKK